MNKKKVLFVATVGGFLMRFLTEHVRTLQSLGYEVHYASNFNRKAYDYDEEQMKKLGVISHRLDIEKSPIALKTNKKALERLIQIIDREQIELVDCHTPLGGVLGRLAGAKSKTKPKVVYTAHGFHFYKGAKGARNIIYKIAEKSLAKKTDYIVTINKEDYEYAKKHLKLKKDCKNKANKTDSNVFLINGMGLDMEIYKNDMSEEEKLKKRSEIIVPPGAFHIVTTAELNKNKNEKAIIKAISLIDKDDIYYSVCGRGPYELSLKDYIKEKRLENRVKLIGYRNDVPQILQTADVFAFPSKREGLGMAALEALSCEVPLIAADNRGTREYALDAENAIVCKRGRVQEYKAAIEKLYNDRELLNRLKKNCRQSVKRFSKETVKRQIDAMYKLIAAGDNQ